MKLKYDGPPSEFRFDCNLRRYAEAVVLVFNPSVEGAFERITAWATASGLADGGGGADGGVGGGDGGAGGGGSGDGDGDGDSAAEICVLVCHYPTAAAAAADDMAEARAADQWGVENGFEAVAAIASEEAVDAAADAGMVLDGDPQGTARVRAALEAHMWPGTGSLDNQHSTDVDSPPPPPRPLSSVYVLRLCEHFLIEVSHALMSIVCMFSMTLLHGLLMKEHPVSGVGGGDGGSGSAIGGSSALGSNDKGGESNGHGGERHGNGNGGAGGREVEVEEEEAAAAATSGGLAGLSEDDGRTVQV